MRDQFQQCLLLCSGCEGTLAVKTYAAMEDASNREGTKMLFAERKFSISSDFGFRILL